MERRHFSIEPYIEAGGIMGNELEVDEDAADSVMKRTALRRDFAVTRGYFREAREFEGDDVLAISTARVHNDREASEVGSSSLSTLIRQNKQWFLQVHDQQVWEKVDKWMQGKYKRAAGVSGHNVFADKFSKELSEETAKALRSAFLNEKKVVAIGSSLSSLKFVGLIGGLGTMTYYFGQAAGFYIQDIWNPNPAEYSVLDRIVPMSKGMVGYWTGYIVGVGAGRIVDRTDFWNIFNNSVYEGFLPNPQVPSIVLGSASIALNSGKLIRLKQKE